MITLISSHAQLRGLEALAQSWVERWPSVKGVCLNLQPKANNLVLGRTTHCLVGVPTIEEQFCGIKLALSSTTFVDAERCFGYRNRALIPLKRDQNGRLKAGYFRPKTHKIVNLNHCPVLDPRLDALVEPLKQDLDAGGWPADHDLLEAQGLRHLGLRLASATGDVLITLISSHAQLRGLEALAQSWVERCLLYTSPSPRDRQKSRMPSSA